MSHPERSEGKGLADHDQPLRYSQGDTARVQGLPTAENRWQVQCLNCGVPLQGAFCSSCGQRAAPPHPTVREIAGDAFSELSGWDGKFAETFRKLLFKPGELTREWIEGKRVSFIAPIRLYLTASLVYFVVSAAAPNLGGRDPDVTALKFSQTETEPTKGGKPQQVAREVNKAIASKQALTGAERDSALAAIASAPTFMQPLMRRAVEDPGSIGTTVRRAMPNVFLALIPVFGLVLALFYRGRNYPEHLFFAIHAATFVFIARTLGNLTLFASNLWIAGVAQALMVVWILAYGVIALRRVYGGSVPMTILKGIGICFVYFLVALPFVAGVVFVILST